MNAEEKNNGWPNQEGKMALDSKLIYHKKIKTLGLYGKEICENQADFTYIAAINPGVHTFLTWYSSIIEHRNFGDNDINRIFSDLILLSMILFHAPPMHLQESIIR